MIAGTAGASRQREAGEAEGSPDLAGWVAGSALFVTLTVALPLLFTDLTAGSFRSAAVSLSYAVIVYASARLSQLIVRGRVALVQAGFWSFVYLFFGLAALADIVKDQFPIQYQTFGSDLEIAALIGILIGVIGFDIGRRIGIRRSPTRPLAQWLDRFEIVPNRVRWLGIVGVLLTLYFTASAGLATRFSSRQTATASLFRGLSRSATARSGAKQGRRAHSGSASLVASVLSAVLGALSPQKS